jgi:hypothetical protein
VLLEEGLWKTLEIDERQKRLLWLSKLLITVTSGRDRGSVKSVPEVWFSYQKGSYRTLPIASYGNNLKKIDAVVDHCPGYRT